MQFSSQQTTEAPARPLRMADGATLPPKHAADTRVSNADFLRAVFHTIPAGASPVVCTLAGDPEEAAQWSAVPHAGVLQHCPPEHNNYFNCSSFHPQADGRLKAQRGAFAACHALLFDDLGTKVPLERFGNFSFSWVAETSPGNYQAGIILDTPLSDPRQATVIHNAIIAKGLCDKGAGGPSSRWARLPVGINGKAKHRRSGLPFECRLVHWDPDRRCSPKQLVAELDLRFPAEPSTAQPAEHDDTAPTETDLAELRALLTVIDADCSYGEWLQVLLALHHESAGSDAGLELADWWSARGDKYAGRREIESKWRSFRTPSETPVTIGSLIKMVTDAGHDWMALLDAAGPQFESCETVVIKSALSEPPLSGARHVLAKYSIRDRLAELERQMVEQRPLLGDIVLMGQATVVYAMANTGKTLITLALLTEAIERKRVDPAKVFYVNMDDNSKGLVEKGRLAQENGFEMLADGYRGFEASAFMEAMLTMIESDTAHGTVIVLDTLKKFVDTMDKGKSSAFAKVVRRFVMKGGTLVALAHTNKNPDKEGNPVYSGTTDIVDDFDCAYTVKTIHQDQKAKEKVVQFTNIKRRGDVPQTAAYRYGWEQGISYADLLMSVGPVEPDDLTPILDAVQVSSDADVIRAIEESIRAGVNTKMLLASAVATRLSLSKRAVTRVLDRYRGSDPAQHRWEVTTKQRGALVHTLLHAHGGSAGAMAASDRPALALVPAGQVAALPPSPLSDASPQGAGAEDELDLEKVAF